METMPTFSSPEDLSAEPVPEVQTAVEVLNELDAATPTDTEATSQVETPVDGTSWRYNERVFMHN